MRFSMDRLIGFGTAALLAASCLTAPVEAQNCAGPPVPGTCALVSPAVALCQEGPGPIGDNLVEIPAFSPVNDTPANPLINGFQDLCAIFGLAGTSSEILQFNAQGGNITTFTCNSAAAPIFQPCQGVLIRPSMNAAGVIPIDPPPAPDFEGSWPYTAYVEGPGPKGDNLYGIPHTTGAGCPAGCPACIGFPPMLTPQDLCLNLGLPAGSVVIRFDACPGIVRTHLCGSVPQYALIEGQAVVIQPTATVTGTVPIP